MNNDRWRLLLVVQWSWLLGMAIAKHWGLLALAVGAFVVYQTVMLDRELR